MDNSKAQYSLLSDELISVAHCGDYLKISLPELLALLGKAEVEVTFPALRPHQFHSWYSFLVQLSAIALNSSDHSETLQDPEEWRLLLLSLTDSRSEPWCLCVPCFSEPAFMQAPIAESKLDTKKWDAIKSPGALDILITSKNHDVKAQLMQHAQPEHWLYALISLQTTEGYSGRDNHGIARMNSGYGSRPCVTVAPDISFPVRYRRDLLILLQNRRELTQSSYRGAPDFMNVGGYGLLWLIPWDGSTSLSLSECDPYFIEICRRVRLTCYREGIRAFTTSSKAPRIAAKEQCGNTGDPWTPIEVTGAEAKALTVSSEGFSYRLVQKLLLSSDYKHGLAWKQKSEKGDMWFIASALARGQGKTEGFHQRLLRIPGKTADLLDELSEEQHMARISHRMIERCDEVRRKVLHISLCVVTQGAPENGLNFRDNSTEKWLERFRGQVDRYFFPELFSNVDFDEEDADQRWVALLIRTAESLLNEALESTPQPSLRRYRIDSHAKRTFYGRVKSLFPAVFERISNEKAKPFMGGEHV